MRAVAYVHGPARVHILARAFAEGCAEHGVKCIVREVETVRREDADVVWLYGLGPARPVFDVYDGALRLVGDKGYFAETGPKGYFRVSVNAQQPDAHLRLRPHPRDRWDALRITSKPVETRGDYILLCGIGPKQADRHEVTYGEWERVTFKRLREMTERPILVREKPGNPPIDGLPRSTHATTAEAIRGARVVVCKTGNLGVDAIVEGVPVIAESGPGRVYFPVGLDAVETVEPLPICERLRALSDVAYWQWQPEEIARGLFLQHLKDEGLCKF